MMEIFTVQLVEHNGWQRVCAYLSSEHIAAAA